MKLQLIEARQRARASFEALSSEMKGSAGATPARYSRWPIGCAVRVAVEDPATGAGRVDGAEPDTLIATLVKYDISLNTFVVKLDDGSTRTVPAQWVTRARAADRACAQSNLAGLSSPSATTFSTNTLA